MKKCTKKQVGQLEFLGYKKDGDVMVCDAIEWIMRTKDFYIMPTPVPSKVFPYYRWRVMVVILGRPNREDGLLNATEIDGRFPTKDEAEVHGLNFVLGSLCEAKILAADISDEDVEAYKKELEESGFVFN